MKKYFLCIAFIFITASPLHAMTYTECKTYTITNDGKKVVVDHGHRWKLAQKDPNDPIILYPTYPETKEPVTQRTLVRHLALSCNQKYLALLVERKQGMPCEQKANGFENPSYASIVKKAHTIVKKAHTVRIPHKIKLFKLPITLWGGTCEAAEKTLLLSSSYEIDDINPIPPALVIVDPEDDDREDIERILFGYSLVCDKHELTYHDTYYTNEYEHMAVSDDGKKIVLGNNTTIVLINTKTNRTKPVAQIAKEKCLRGVRFKKLTLLQSDTKLFVEYTDGTHTHHAL